MIMIYSWYIPSVRDSKGGVLQSGTDGVEQ